MGIVIGNDKIPKPSEICVGGNFIDEKESKVHPFQVIRLHMILETESDSLSSVDGWV